MGFWDGSGISGTICKQSAPLCEQITTPTPIHSIITGRMLFLMPNRQCQSTEGNSTGDVLLLLSRKCCAFESRSRFESGFESGSRLEYWSECRLKSRQESGSWLDSRSRFTLLRVLVCWLTDTGFAVLVPVSQQTEIRVSPGEYWDCQKVTCTIEHNTVKCGICSGHSLG